MKRLRVAGACTLEDANRYLAAEFLPWWNQHLVSAPANAADAHRPLGPEHNLPQALCWVEARQVNNDYTFQRAGQLYQIERDSICAGLRGALIRIERRLEWQSGGSVSRAQIQNPKTYNSAMTRLPVALLFAACGIPAFGADTSTSSVSKIFDGQLSMVEHEVVTLAEAMPADKYDFAPTHGEFKGVRTFGQQVGHVAAVMYLVSASALGEKNPSEGGKGENGPASLKTKDDYVNYLKAAIAYSHRAMQSLTSQNLTGMVKSAFGDGEVPRASMATAAVWHTFDHYGQMVVYARMNGIIPPASRQ